MPWPELTNSPLSGRASDPVPLLMYSPGVYFARLVDLILENAPIFGTRVIESDMSDVLCGMALGGRGIAWLTEVPWRRRAGSG